jgi:Mg-chelatase subunit ChlD
MSTAIVKGSLGDVAQCSGASIAEAFVGADIVVIVDTSGSMQARDSRGGRSRYNVACDELRSLQEHNAGKIAVLSFSGYTVFCPNGKPQFLGGGTDMAGALKFAKIADVSGMRFVLISDGHPDDEQKALATARAYTNRIDTIFVGREDDSRARAFLLRLAQATGGQHVNIGVAQEALATTVQKMLAG